MHLNARVKLVHYQFTSVALANEFDVKIQR